MDTSLASSSSHQCCNCNKQEQKGPLDSIASLIPLVGGLLQKPEIEQTEQTSDRISASTSNFAGSIVQAAVKPSAPRQPVYQTQDDFLSMQYTHRSAEVNPTKLVEIGAGKWEINLSRGDNIFQVPLPLAFWDKPEKPAYGQSRYFAYVRTGFHFQIQVNVQTGSAGSIIAFYTPMSARDDQENANFDSFLNFPHVILNANTVTQADLFIPYINFNNYAQTDSNELGYLSVRVWTQLTIPAGSSNTIDVTCYGSLLDLDFQNPRPILAPSFMEAPPAKKRYSVTTKYKWSRKKIDIAEGPGSMNLANRLSTAGGQSVALVGERAYYDGRTAGTESRIGNMLEIYQMPSVIKGGYFSWPNSSTPKTTIFQTNLNLEQIPNLDLGCACYQFYRGSIVLELTVYNSAFNKGRLKMCFFPNTQTLYTYDQANNSQFIIADIGLNSTFQMTLPFAYKDWMRPTRGDSVVGRIQIFVVNRLTFNSSSPSQIWCVLTAKAGNDFMYMVPSTSASIWQSWGSEMDLVDPIDSPEVIQTQQDPKPTFSSPDAEYQQSSKMAEDVGLASIENVGTQDQQISQAQPKFLNFKVQKRNIFTVSHTDVDNIFGRAWTVQSASYTSSTVIKIQCRAPASSHAVQMRFFAFFSGEINFHITNQSAGELDVVHGFDLPDWMSFPESHGVMAIPPMELMTICVPWYSQTPLRPVIDSSMSLFGTLYLRPQVPSGRYIVRASLRNPNFFFKMPARKRVTALSILDSEDPLQYLISEDDFSDLMYNLKKDENADFERRKEHSRSRLADLIQHARQWYLDRKGHRKELLTQCGDVEQNPGPIQLVYKDRGFYKHYGIRTEEGVWNLNSEDLVKTIMRGEAKFILSPNTPDWKMEKEFEADHFTLQALESMKFSRHIFSCDLNCESLARAILSDTSRKSQAKALSMASMIILAAMFSYFMVGSVDELVMQKFFNQSNEPEEMTNLVQRATTFFSTTCVSSIEHTLVKTILMFLARILCYLIMYCHCPNILTTMSFGVLLMMDIKATHILDGETAGLLKSLLDGDMKKLCEIIVEKIQFETHEEKQQLVEDTIKATTSLFSTEESLTQQESFSDFNKFSMSARHMDWWMSKIQSLIKWLKTIFGSDTSREALNWLRDHQGFLSDLLITSSNHLISMRDPEYAKKKDNQVKHRYLLNRLSWCASIFAENQISSPLCNLLMRIHTQMLNCQYQQPYSGMFTRMEPIGIWITGDPGVGKSFLSHALISQICKMTKLSSVWPHPSGSEFMDSYAGQDIHYIDDLGQNREENDIALLCQCISSMPFIVPMASLSEKGSEYSSKIVIVTTNKNDFSTTVLSDSGALERRFPFKIKVRPHIAYSKAGKLDVDRSMTMMYEGSCWEICEDGRTWKTCSISDLASKVSSLFERRTVAFQHWNTQLTQNQSADDDQAILDVEVEEHPLSRRFVLSSNYLQRNGLSSQICLENLKDDFLRIDCPLPCLEIERDQREKIQLDRADSKFIAWIQNAFNRIKSFYERNHAWFKLIGVLGTFIGIGLSIWRILKTDEKDERAYNPQTTSSKGGTLARSVVKAKAKFDLPTSNESWNEYIHLAQYCCYFATEKNMLNPIHGILLGSNQVLTYAHSRQWFGKYSDEQIHIFCKGVSYPCDELEIQELTYQGVDLDLCIIRIKKLPILFKNSKKHICAQIGKEPKLMWLTKYGMLVKDVGQVYYSGRNITQEGTVSANTVRYPVDSKKGMCGGILITNVGGAYKICGMHIAGNGFEGVSVLLYPTLQMKDEGVVVNVEKAQIMFTPAVSKLQKSPIHGCYEELKQPAALSPRDPRIEVPCNNLVKLSAQKYRRNRFDPEESLMNAVESFVATSFQKYYGKHHPLMLHQAVKGVDGLNPIDMNTSAGVKYQSRGLKKRDLLAIEPFWISDRLAMDIKKYWDALSSGKNPEVLFGCFLKDELRPIQKIKDANTRCIEAAPLDYVLVHRQILGGIYSQFYSKPCVLTGMCPGINPWTDFDMMMSCLHENCYNLDFSKYDGSLSAEIMEMGVEIIKGCSEVPHLVDQIFKPVITSQHHVFDEVWTVYGGMPSGAPCTTILNTICNLLMSRYCAILASSALEQDEVVIFAYGDDVVVSTEEEMDTTVFVDSMYKHFGMTVTDANKKLGINKLDKNEISFLKRKPKFFPGTQFFVGQLDLSEMKQNIMWMHGMKEFEQQLTSFENELVLHGQEVYERTIQEMKDHLDGYPLNFSNWNTALRRMTGYVFG
ncbi:polyprotein [Yili teratoscincus roborowskii picornavirus 2]|uniref:Genome polyprotein n=1 Tax=parechovirus F1 TaxID=2870370 RepID=A0A2P1GN45_9PICO|nr:polyprotein [Yili teratoscincus roborowskii picornavirus 2]AVM87411.1 polyprotein [parechovirus F1]